MATLSQDGRPMTTAYQWEHRLRDGYTPELLSALKAQARGKGTTELHRGVRVVYYRFGDGSAICLFRNTDNRTVFAEITVE